jgi:hypothetical protein
MKPEAGCILKRPADKGVDGDHNGYRKQIAWPAEATGEGSRRLSHITRKTTFASQCASARAVANICAPPRKRFQISAAASCVITLTTPPGR